MRYRPYGQTGFQVSALGFGCMRFPRTAEGGIDELKTTEMLEYALQKGVNYFDTAYPYHNGESERFLGRFFQNGKRQRVWLATKQPGWKVETADDFDRLLDEQMEKLQTDYVNVYLLHGLRRERWDHLRNLGVTDWLDKARSDGRIHHAGFSFHDKLEVFKEIIDAYDGWTMCQIQYNFMNEDHQAGTEGLKYASDKGLAVVIMEPLLGGRLAIPPKPVQEIWESMPIDRSGVEWALQWLWNKPEVSVVLSGMSAIEHVKENTAHASRSCVGILTAQELESVEKARQAYENLAPVPCTSCEYCLPCPNGVAIPRNFSILNQALMFGNMEDARRRYTWRPDDADEAMLGSACLACLECEAKCPQNIPISEWMPYLHAVLGEGQKYDPAVPLGFGI
jgi:predicted aldo/keto reductase-like oxidoreductase